jgi:hypothetical protein
VTKFAYSIHFVYFALTAHDSDVLTMVVTGAIITIVHDDDDDDDDDSDKYPVF